MPDFIYLAVETAAPLHVGSRQRAGDVSDSLFRRTAGGQLVLPGTAIAGAIRGHLTRIVPAMTALGDKRVICTALESDLHPAQTDQTCGCVICHLMGEVNPLNLVRPGKPEEVNGRASRLFVNDALIKPDAVTRIRDGVGIDRATGAAARRTQSKYDVETLPAEARFEIALEMEDADETDWRLLMLALDEWQQGRIRFGGRSRQGLGLLALRSVRVARLDIAEHLDHLMVLLRETDYSDMAQETDPATCGPGRNHHAGYRDVPGSVQSWVWIDFELAVDGFFLANDASEADAIGFDHVSGPRSRPVYPGSSLRGVLRSQAERIARTIVTLESKNEPEFLDRCPASDPLITYQAEDNREIGLESGPSRLRSSKEATSEQKQNPPFEWFDLADQLFGNTYFGSRLIVEDAFLAGDPSWKPLDFLAIDRFTGGGAEHLKFDALALWKPVFNGRIFFESPRSWEMGWLLYVLKDLMDGRVPIGFGAAKGFGRAVMPRVGFTFGWAYDEIWREHGLSAPQPRQEGYFRQARYEGWHELPVEWKRTWADAWLNTVQNYRVEPLLRHAGNTDPYFGAQFNGLEMTDLYPKEITHDRLYSG